MEDSKVNVNVQDILEFDIIVTERLRCVLDLLAKSFSTLRSPKFSDVVMDLIYSRSFVQNYYVLRENKDSSKAGFIEYNGIRLYPKFGISDTGCVFAYDVVDDYVYMITEGTRWSAEDRRTKVFPVSDSSAWSKAKNILELLEPYFVSLMKEAHRYNEITDVTAKYRIYAHSAYSHYQKALNLVDLELEKLEYYE